MPNRKTRVWIEENIVRIDFGYRAHITVADLEEMVALYRQSKFEKRPALICGERVRYLDYDAGQYASHPDVVSCTQALGIVTQTVTEEVIGKNFIRFHRPPYPVRLFAEQSKALQWLSQFNCVSSNIVEAAECEPSLN